MSNFERKLRMLTSYGLYFFGGLVLVIETFVYGLLNPELTQMQVFIEKWPVILVCAVAFFVAYQMYPEATE